MQRSEKQAGFSVVSVVAVIAVVTLLGSAGWFVYQHNRTKSTQAAANTSNQQTQQTTTTTPATTVAYLDVKEWGIKLPLPASVKDAYYVASNGSADANGQPNTIWLGLKSLDNAGCAASLGNSKGADAPIGAIGRALPTDHEPVMGTLYTQLYPGVTIGGYYYFYISNTQGKTCASSTLLQSADAAFANATKNAFSDTGTSISPTSTTSYLTISEWEVKAPYSGDLKLSYILSADGKSAFFSSGQLTAISSECIGKGGTIFRWASTDKVLEGPTDANTPTAEQAFAGKDPTSVPYAHIGNYYYTFAHAQSGCGDIAITASLQAQTNDAVKALLTHFQSNAN